MVSMVSMGSHSSYLGNRHFRKWRYLPGLTIHWLHGEEEVPIVDMRGLLRTRTTNVVQTPLHVCIQLQKVNLHTHTHTHTHTHVHTCTHMYTHTHTHTHTHRIMYQAAILGVNRISAEPAILQLSAMETLQKGRWSFPLATQAALPSSEQKTLMERSGLTPHLSLR